MSGIRSWSGRKTNKATLMDEKDKQWNDIVPAIKALQATLSDLRKRVEQMEPKKKTKDQLIQNIKDAIIKYEKHTGNTMERIDVGHIETTSFGPTTFELDHIVVIARRAFRSGPRRSSEKISMQAEDVNKCDECDECGRMHRREIYPGESRTCHPFCDCAFGRAKRQQFEDLLEEKK